LATIKDVAKYANVSIGTVSNVLNGKTQNTELIDRVENAIKLLSYRPDANARSLKNTRSGLIGVILPNMEDSFYSALLFAVEAALKERGYSVLIKFSQNNRLIERKSIEQCLEQCVDGVIIYSNSSGAAFEKFSFENIPLVIIGTRGTSGSWDSIHVDYGDALEKALRRCRDAGINEVGLIVESNFFNDVFKANKNRFREKKNVKIVDSSKERGFKAAYELLFENPKIGGIIAGNALIALGIRKALNLMEISNVSLTVIKERNWIEDEGTNAAQISVSYRQVAQNAAERLFDALDNPNMHEALSQSIKAVYSETMPDFNISKGGGTIRIAMFDCPAAQSLKMLSDIYAKKSGVCVNLEVLAYDDLKDAAYGISASNPDFDGYMIDITWLDSLAESGSLFSLENLKREHPRYFEGFIMDMLSEYGEYGGQLFALPFMSGTQLMFYQKDLFEDRTQGHRFNRMYGEQLLPPVTWAQYNLVAEFFTRSFNPKSPVKYGLSNVRGDNVYTTISFLNRLWSYGSDVFGQDGRVLINGSNALAALKNFTKSYQYCSDRKITSWDEMVDEFISGDTAMVILYDSHSAEINDFTKSRIAGNIGYSLIPGGTPALGGWSLAANSYGKNSRSAVNFFMWACSEQNEFPITLLGGSTLRSDFYSRTDLESIYPWKSMLTESYSQSKKRILPKPFCNCAQKDDIYTHIISHEINEAIEKRISEKEALQNIERLLFKLV
jgi:Transcriptional regulators